jgi:hypothetical protein
MRPPRPAPDPEEDIEMTQIIAERPLLEPADTEPPPGTSTRRPRAGRVRLSFFEPASLLPTYLGILVTIAGFALIALAWAKVAALTDVALQLPYLVSAGLTGLALVMVGLIVINIAAKRQDAAERARQLQTLSEALADLARSLEGEIDVE